MDTEDELQKIRIDTREQLGAIPRVLRELQELVPLLSVAYSTDGRTFGYEAPLSMSIPLGSYVALSTQDGREYLGQIITKEVSIRQGAEIGLELDPGLSALLPEGVNLSPSHTYPLQRRYAHATGVILGRRDSKGCVPTTGEDGFQSADLARTGEDLVARYLTANSASTLEIGRSLHTDGRLRAPRIPRTCCASGSATSKGMSRDWFWVWTRCGIGKSSTPTGAPSRGSPGRAIRSLR